MKLGTYLPCTSAPILQYPTPQAALHGKEGCDVSRRGCAAGPVTGRSRRSIWPTWKELHLGDKPAWDLHTENRRATATQADCFIPEWCLGHLADSMCCRTLFRSDFLSSRNHPPRRKIDAVSDADCVAFGLWGWLELP